MKTKAIVRLSMTILLFMIVGYTMLGEKVAINNGEGWDGEYYYDIATNFFNRVQHESYNKYRIQRVFPFAIINAVTEVCHIEKTHENMLPMMQMLNAIALMACVMFFYLTSNRLRLALVWESIWFASLFYCFPILKAIGYYPYSTDLFGYLCGFAIYYFFLKKNSIGLFITAFCGAYTWPVVSISALALAFLRTEPVKIYNQELGRTNKIINKWIKIAFVALPLIYIFLEYSVHSKFSYEFLMDRLYCISRPVNAYIFVLSVLCVGLYLFCIVKPITINVTGVISDLFTKHKKNLLLFLVCYILIHISTMLISNDEIVDLDMYGLVRLNVLWATSNPFVFLVNHFLFYGFSIVLIIMFWKKLAQAICDEGIGFVGILTLIIFFSLRTESRVSIMFYPLLIFPLATILNKYKIPVGWCVTYVVASIIYSHFWLPINVEGIEEAFSWDCVGPSPTKYLDFPAQRWFMNHGHWQRAEIYYIYAVLMILCYLLFKKLSKKVAEKQK